MKIEFNKTGSERKVLVSAIAEFLELKPKYLGMPTMAYQIGEFTVDKNGDLNFDSNIEVERLLKFLARKGFTPQGTKTTNTCVDEVVEKTSDRSQSEPHSESLGLTVAMPRDYFSKDSLENLQRLIGSKASLIKKALGIESLPIQVDDEKVSFPWFEIKPMDNQSVTAYTHFIYALCEMAKNQKRVNAKEKEVQNEKYAFRCFLLRLGFIGEKYKSERKILLKNLSGSSAFKGGKNELSK